MTEVGESGWCTGAVPLQVVQAGWVHGEGGSPEGYDVAQEGLSWLTLTLPPNPDPNPNPNPNPNLTLP